MGEPTTEEPRADVAPAPAVKLRSIEFTSSQHILKGCKDDVGWKNAGAPCPSPEWTPGAAYPVSFAMDEPVVVKLAFDPAGGEPGAAPIALTAHGPAGLGVVRPAPGTTPDPAAFVTASSGKIEKKIQKLDLILRWSASPAGLVSPENTSNVAYVTMGKPRDDQQQAWQEDGVTVKRMDRSVAWVGALDTLDPHQIVGGLMAKFPSYTLLPSPKVPRQFHHPTYFNEEGGAWPMSDYVAESGECQAIVRLVRGVLRQLGIPGQARVIVIWADPREGNGRTALSADLEARPGAGLDATRVENGRRWLAALVDSPVEEGKTYPASHTVTPGGRVSPGLNRFEACLAFTLGGKTLYYAGGVGPGGVFEHKQQILNVFWGLLWVSSAGDDGFKVEKIVARYGSEGGVA